MLKTIDRLAGLWLDWRQSRAIKRDPDLCEKFDVKRVAVEDGELKGTFVTPAAAILAEGMSQMLTDAGAENYVQFDMLPRMDRGLRTVRVTVQWADGETPAGKAARLTKQIQEALAVAAEDGQTDGDHHKLWVIDQMVRALTGNEYAEWVTRYQDGEDGPETYCWETGIAP